MLVSTKIVSANRSLINSTAVCIAAILSPNIVCRGRNFVPTCLDILNDGSGTMLPAVSNPVRLSIILDCNTAGGATLSPSLSSAHSMCGGLSTAERNSSTCNTCRLLTKSLSKLYVMTLFSPLIATYLSGPNINSLAISPTGIVLPPMVSVYCLLATQK